jgi:hypothetical protein
MLDGIDGTFRSQFWHSKCEIWCAWMAEETMTDRGGDAVKERLLDIYLKSRVGREPMHRAAVQLLHCHGASLDPLQVLEICCFHWLLRQLLA